MRSPSLPPSQRARGVTAILGPTNTGKTHLAIERMLAHPSGIIGLPLRLLAREVYERAVARVGAPAVDRKSTRLNSSHSQQSRMPSSA